MNHGKSSGYPRQIPVRHGPRNQKPQKLGFGKRLMEEFFTQFTICTLVIGLILGAQLFKLPNINDSISKIKTIITYSPSLKEIAQEAKEGSSALIEKISATDKRVNDDQINTEELPIILVDDEIF